MENEYTINLKHIDCRIRKVRFIVEQNGGEYEGATTIQFDDDIVAIVLIEDKHE